MKFSIRKEALLRCLSVVSPAVNSSSIMPILKTIKLEVKDNRLFVQATDVTTYIEAWVEANVDEEGACCVDNSLSQIMGAFTEDEINFEKQKTLKISQGTSTYRLPIVDAEEFPVFPDIENSYTLTSIVPLCVAVSKCDFATSSGGERPVLETVLFNIKEQYVIGADGFRLSMVENVKMGQGETSIIQGKAIKAIENLLKSAISEVQLSIGDWFFVESKHWKLAVNSMAGEYPNAKVLADNTKAQGAKTSIKIPKDNLTSKLRVAAMFSKKAYDAAKPYHLILTITDNKIELSMKVESVIDFKEELECTKIGQDLEIRVDPKQLLEAIGVIKSTSVEIGFGEYNQPFMVVDNDNKDWTYIQMPMVDYSKEEKEEKSDF